MFNPLSKKSESEIPMQSWKKNFLSTSIIVLVTVVSQAQWLPDVRLTNDPASSQTSFNNAWCVASIGDTVHIVWWDIRDGNYEIYYKRSTDGGVSWGADTRLTNNSATSSSPSISVSGPVVHVVWNDERDGNYEIYYKRSIDGGISWGTDTRLTNDSDISRNPSIVVSGQDVHIVYDWRSPNLDCRIHYNRSTDGGSTWGADTSIGGAPPGSFNYPSVAVSGQVVHVAWWVPADGIRYIRSTDGGLSWSAVTWLTYNAIDALNLSISVSDSVVHVVWNDGRDGNYEIYYIRSTDGGISWGANTRLTNNNADSFIPSVAVSGQVVHVVWTDHRDGNWEIYYKCSTDGGISWGADTRLTNYTGLSDFPSVSASGSSVHVVWYDERNGNREIYYKCDPIGNSVDIDESFLNENTLQFYPNPFSGSMVISFFLTQSQKVSLKIFDVNGRLVSTLADKKFEAGENEIVWNAEDMEEGIYFLRLESADNSKNRKLIITK